jgi:hypothetical protein
VAARNCQGIIVKVKAGRLLESKSGEIFLELAEVLYSAPVVSLTFTGITVFEEKPFFHQKFVYMTNKFCHD